MYLRTPHLVIFFRSLFTLQAYPGGGKAGVLLQTTDQALIYVKSGQHMFTREESLADVMYGGFLVTESGQFLHPTELESGQFYGTEMEV